MTFSFLVRKIATCQITRVSFKCVRSSIKDFKFSGLYHHTFKGYRQEPF